MKLEAFATSTVLILAEEMLERMRVETGDTLFVVQTPNGYLLTPEDPEVARQLELGCEGMRRFREAYQRLAQ